MRVVIVSDPPWLGSPHGATPWFKWQPEATFVPWQEIDSAIALRASARARKDFDEADRIRSVMLARGIVFEDRPDGTTDWRGK